MAEGCRTAGQSFPLGHDSSAAPVDPYGFKPVVRVQSISFASDQDVLLNWNKDWTDGGGKAIRFSKPEWTLNNMVCRTIGAPVSHTVEKPVVLVVRLRYEAEPGSRPCVGHLVGNGPGKMVFMANQIELNPGEEKPVRLESIGVIEPKRVFALMFRVEWRFWAAGILALECVSVNRIFVTMKTPETVREFPGVTLWRMHHAVRMMTLIQNEIEEFAMRPIAGDTTSDEDKRLAALTKIQNPHWIVERLVYRTKK